MHRRGCKKLPAGMKRAHAAALPMSARWLLAIACAATLAHAPGCATTRSPELRVIGVHDAPRREVVFVQVINPASRTMRLTKLEYVFASQGQAVSQGEMVLYRDVPAGSAVVVEVPLESHDSHASGSLELRGRLTATVDQIVRRFSVSARVPETAN